MKEKHADWQLLPNDIKLLILTHLKFSKLIAYSEVCNQWNELIKNASLIWIPKITNLLRKHPIDTSNITGIKKQTNESYFIILKTLNQKFSIINNLELKLNASLDKKYNEKLYNNKNSADLYLINNPPYVFSFGLAASASPSFCDNNKNWKKLKFFVIQNYYKTELKKANISLQNYLDCHLSISSRN